MPQASMLDRVLPCLFDRLVDLTPKEQVEARGERVVSVARYRESVIRDIEWLLGSSGHLEEEGLDDFPEVKRSVFNFGRRGMTGLNLSSLDPVLVEANIAEAIRQFEPRIDPATVKVRCAAKDNKGRKGPGTGSFNLIGFEISGELWALPAPEEFSMKTTIDMDACTRAS